MKRRPRFRWRHLPLLILLALLLVGLYGGLLEPRWLAVTRVAIPLPRLPAAFDGLTVAVLSDVHYPDFLGPRHFRRVVRKTNALHPDLIVITGDFLTGDAKHVAPCAAILGELRAPLGVYAVLGNHDYWSRNTRAITEEFATVGITVLTNRSTALTRDGARLWIVGLDDYWAGRPDPQQALRGVPEAEAKILLVHEPDYADVARTLPVDLQLSGHSHGGQVRLPIIGGLHYPPLGERYPMGRYQVGPLPLYTNRGVGVILPLRFNCRPEITRLTLNRP